MTKDDMIRMVSAASGDGGVDELTGDAIERFYHLAVAAEREACEEACDELIGDGSSPPDWNQGVLSAIEAIRARSHP